MELDHLFLFTNAAEQAADALHRIGLTEGAPNTHPGQGTACRRFFFRNAYLELLWVTSDEEIKSPAIAPTKLWERFQYPHTGYCPFGLCFRSGTTVFEEGWQYRPPYLPNDLYINVAPNTDRPTEPMLFELPFSNIAPQNYPLARQQPLQHEKGFSEITQVRLTLPDTRSLSPSLQKVMTHSPVTVAEERSYVMDVEFDGGKMGKVQDFTSIIPLIIRW